MEITAIDDSDFVGWVAAATRTGEVFMGSTQGLVAAVIKKLDGRKLTRLNVLDHGNKDTIQFGRDRVTTQNFPEFEPALVKLKPYFASIASVHFQHCDAGQNHALLHLFAKMWQVPIFAGTGKHNPLYRFNFGEYVRCLPDGSCWSGVSRP